MPDSLTLDFINIDKLTKGLGGLGLSIRNRVGKNAVKVGAKYLLEKVRLEAPVKTGRLRDSLFVKASKIHTIRKTGEVGVFVSARRGKTKKDKGGAYYAKFVENGTKYQHARHFASNTFKTNVQQASTLVVVTFESQAKTLLKNI